jgi:HEAT repeat protein
MLNQDEAAKLVKQLRSGGDSERWEASQAVAYACDGTVAMPEELAEALVSALRESTTSNEAHSGIRYWCCRALGNIAVGTETIVHELARVTNGSDSPSAQHAADALAKIGQPALEPLLDCLKADDVNIRRYAAGAFRWNAELVRQAIEALETAFLDEDVLVSRAACESLAVIGSDAVPALSRAVANSPTEERVYYFGCALFHIGDCGLLRRLLHDDNVYVRRAAANALGTAGFEEDAAAAILELGRALADEDAQVRQGAASALEGIGCEFSPERSTLNAIRNELLIASENEDPTVRNFSVRCLRFVDNDIPAVVDQLIKRLYDKDELVHHFAIQELGNLGKRASKAVPYLIETVRTNDENKSSALEALGRIGRSATTAVPLLLELYRTDGTHKSDVLDALKRIDPDAYDELSEQ